MMTKIESKQEERRRQEKLVRETADMIDETSSMLGEVSRVLQTSRWETREGPFRGFDSPPGRF